MIDRSRFRSKLISFELSLGNAGNQQFPHSQCAEDHKGGLPGTDIFISGVFAFLAEAF